MKKFHQRPSILVDIWNRFANFEAIVLQILLINVEENGSCDQKKLLIKYFKYFII